jgi:hypothetical protein
MDGSVVDGLVTVPAEAMISDLTRAFPGAVREPNGAGDWLVWESASEPGMLEASWTDQYLMANCRNLTDDQMNRIIDVALGHGCPLYDPQTGERFAT